jgi:hypothetical protein
VSLHKEIAYEDEVCDRLSARGWLYAEGDAAKYNRSLALFPPDVLAWVQQAHRSAWDSLTKNNGAKAGDVLLARVREQMNARGTLDLSPLHVPTPSPFQSDGFLTDMLGQPNAHGRMRRRCRSAFHSASRSCWAPYRLIADR